MTTIWFIALVVSGVVAGLSAVAIPFWLMGVPGVENAYAKGWKIGLYVIAAYPIAWLCLFGFWRAARKQVEAEQMSSLSLWVGVGSLGLLAAAISALLYSFRVMSRR